MNIIILPMKLPSLNEYIRACRENRYSGAKMKKQVEDDIGYFINKLPSFNNPVRIHFTWVEENKRRDLDNVCFAKKFILDSLVKAGKLKDDNRKHVVGFTDSFEYGDKAEVVIEIEEITDENN